MFNLALGKVMNWRVMLTVVRLTISVDALVSMSWSIVGQDDDLESMELDLESIECVSSHTPYNDYSETSLFWTPLGLKNYPV